MTESPNNNGKLMTFTRWAAWERDVLAKVHEPAKCLELIQQRQAEIDDDASEADLVADHFREQVREAGLDPDECYVFIAVDTLVTWLQGATGEQRPKTKVTPYLKTLSIAELAPGRTGHARGWTWRGTKAKKGQKLVRLDRLKYVPTEH